MAAGAIVYLFLCFTLGLLPAIIAFQRGHESRVSILLLNLFLGWTGIGWVVALVWSAGRTSAPSGASVIVNNHVFVQGHQSTMETGLPYAPEPAMQILPSPKEYAPRGYVPSPAAPKAFGKRTSY